MDWTQWPRLIRAWLLACVTIAAILLTASATFNKAPDQIGIILFVILLIPLATAFHTVFFVLLARRFQWGMRTTICAWVLFAAFFAYGLATQDNARLDLTARTLIATLCIIAGLAGGATFWWAGPKKVNKP